MKKIADAGLLVAFFNRADRHHAWAKAIFQRESPPFYIAEPVLTEVAAVLGSADGILRMVETDDLVITFQLQEHATALRSLMHKYRDQDMELADACCVRMAELMQGSTVYTVDKTDFSIYRKSNRQPIPCVFPD